MRSVQLPVLALIVALSTVPVAETQQPVVKDPTAVTILAQSAAATGWHRLNAPSDVIATGTVTRYREGTQDTVAITLKAKGFRKSRIELPGGLTTILNDDGGAATLVEGTRRIPASSASSLRAAAFPFLGDFITFGDPDVQVRYLGTETVRNELSHRVEITGTGSRPLTVWISASSALPVQIEYMVVAIDNPSARRAHTRYLGDYRPVGGLAVPFYQEESVEGVPLHTLRLTNAQFNVGLSDSEFIVPTGGR